MYKLVFFVPEEHLEPVKHAIFNEGGGRIGHYDQCCWQTKGQGQFRPLAGSKPFLGQHQTRELVAEYRVELVCEETLIRPVVEALKVAHPYEEPAYEVYKLENI